MTEIRHLPQAATETRLLSGGQEVTPHRHDDHQLIFASAGVLEVIVAEGTWFTPPVRAVWLPGGTVHRWQVHGTTTVHLVGIPAAMAPPVARSPSLVRVRPLFRELMIACSQETDPDSDAARRLLRVLVDRTELSVEAPTMLPILHDPRLQDVQALLEADLTASGTLAELGRRVGASERTLSRLFRTTVGMGFPVWRNQLRLHRATRMLATGQSVTDVAAACGYSSASAFIATFRTAFGRTPAALYR